MEQSQFKQAEESNEYHSMLIAHLDALSVLYFKVQCDYAKSTRSEETFNHCLAERIVITDHIIPKLEGGGEKTRELLEEFKKFSDWTENILIPKIKNEESKRVHKLFKLIIKAYDKLGLTNNVQAIQNLFTISNSTISATKKWGHV